MSPGQGRQAQIPQGGGYMDTAALNSVKSALYYLNNTFVRNTRLEVDPGKNNIVPIQDIVDTGKHLPKDISASSMKTLEVSVQKKLSLDLNLKTENKNISLKIDYEFQGTYRAISNNNINAAYKSLQPNKALAALKDYFSPENTANRIINFARNMFKLYKSLPENQNQSETEVIDNFLNLAINSIKQGVSQAKEIIFGNPQEIDPDSLMGQIKEDINKTEYLVVEGLKKFFNKLKSEVNTQNTESSHSSARLKVNVEYSYKLDQQGTAAKPPLPFLI